MNRRERPAASADGERGDRLRQSTLLRIVIAVLVGIIAGLLVTIRSLDLASRGTLVGAWRTAPRDGSGRVGPYALAAVSRAGLLPLGESEGLSFVARADSGGTMLEGRCSYTVKGPMPPARFWTLSLLDPAGFPLANPAERYAFTSAEVLRFEKIPVAVAVAPDARSGNWLPTGTRDRFVLMLRLYDTSLTAGGTDFSSLKMPAIERGDCP